MLPQAENECIGKLINLQYSFGVTRPMETAYRVLAVMRRHHTHTHMYRYMYELES